MFKPTNTPAPFPYTGNPKTRVDTPGKEKYREVKTADSDALKDPSHYLASPELAAAVNVALELGLPLLLTGAPGCGKSRLADAVAYELGLNDDQGNPKALRYTVKSDTQGRDLFYNFDTLGRFRNANTANEERQLAKEFITYHGLGLALLRAKGRREEFKNIMRLEQWQSLPLHEGEDHEGKKVLLGERSVVLIDEIDKAPREVPNDLLTEIEDLSFRIPELGHMRVPELSHMCRMPEIKLDESEKINRPIIIITSNSERDLPPAFLRRCIYFHVEMPPFRAEQPDAPVTIEKIVQERLGEALKGHDHYLADALKLFRQFQTPDVRLMHKPSLAELLQWLLFLSRRPPEKGTKLKDHGDFPASLGVLVKPRNDQERQVCEAVVNKWKEAGA
jgi:MoxR-like ATPase